jgi:aquaporin Z
MINPNKYLAEFLGTMLLVVCVLASSGQALVVGGALATAVYFTSTLSGGHINPAVSLAMYINKKISVNDLAGYLVSQLSAAIVSVYLYNFVITL